jgi:hypothetical protein
MFLSHLDGASWSYTDTAECNVIALTVCTVTLSCANSELRSVRPVNSVASALNVSHWHTV